MVEYKIIHQVPGRIKIKVPLIKGMSVSKLQSMAEKLFSDLELPQGIKKVSPNPLTGNVVIEYDPKKVDILLFIEELKQRLNNLDLKNLK